MQTNRSTTRTVRTTVGGLVLAAVTALGAAVMPSAGAATAPADGSAAAQAATAWIADQLDAQIPMQNFGAPDWGVTLDATLGMVAAGSGGAQVDAVWEALLADRESAVSPGSVDAPGRLARVIVLAVQTGRDPRAVGAAPGADLVARLEASRRTAGPDAGLYGSADPTYDGAFRQGYAIAALTAAGETPDPSAVGWLLGQQCGADGAPGAWMPYRSDLTVPCAFDANMFVGPDTNATAAAITGLDAAGAGADAVTAALGWLDSAQEPDGGWAQLAGFGTDPNSTALVLQALLALGAQDDPRFDDQAASPLEALLAYQLGCDTPEADRGAFTFPGSNGAPNGFATAQAIAPAAGQPFLGDPASLDPGVSPLDCSTPSTTTTTVAPTTVAPTTAAPTTATPTTATPTSTAPVAVGAQVQGVSQTAARPSTTSLALTGAPSSVLLGAGVVAVLVGFVLLADSRRRRDA